MHSIVISNCKRVTLGYVHQIYESNSLKYKQTKQHSWHHKEVFYNSPGVITLYWRYNQHREQKRRNTWRTRGSTYTFTPQLHYTTPKKKSTEARNHSSWWCFIINNHLYSFWLPAPLHIKIQATRYHENNQNVWRFFCARRGCRIGYVCFAWLLVWVYIQYICDSVSLKIEEGVAAVESHLCLAVVRCYLLGYGWLVLCAAGVIRWCNLC